ncbi:unnamed protein product [Schistosoma curassoni]|uniref:FERM domain-containing protein n=1 Tax=Schistosoma curassoni TaxID=6186 RepID=A0A183JBM2_9TREM|nr:unnamed protein product [Schistosoma curassoni]
MFLILNNRNNIFQVTFPTLPTPNLVQLHYFCLDLIQH